MERVSALTHSQPRISIAQPFYPLFIPSSKVLTVWYYLHIYFSLCWHQFEHIWHKNVQNQHIWCKNVQNPVLGSALIPKHWQQVCLVGNTPLTRSCITTRDNRHSLSKEISPLYKCIHIYVCYCMLYTSVLKRK